MSRRAVLLCVLGVAGALALTRAGAAGTFCVATTGNDANPGSEAQPWRTVQKACDAATPGSTVLIRGGIYNEKVIVHVSGSAADGFVTLAAFPGERVVLDGTGKAGSNLVLIEDRSYLRLIGLELTGNRGVHDGSGIRITGAGDHLEIRNCKITEIRGSDAMGITVYGTGASQAISNLVIDGNEIAGCDPAHSEALTLNGNVDAFEVTGNYVHDVNNIGIDFIGGEGTCSVPANDRARNGLCRGNRVTRARSSYGGGYAAGIYVDGGSSIILERNVVSECDVGIEVGAENQGWVSSGVVVRSNLVFENDKWGLGFGGYEYGHTGTVVDCRLVNNTLFANDTLRTGVGELVVQVAQRCLVANNILAASDQNVLLVAIDQGNVSNLLDHNLYFSPGGAGAATVDWRGTVYTGFADYLAGSGQDSHSFFANPGLVSPVLPAPNLHLLPDSPAIDAGDESTGALAGSEDIDGQPRVRGARIDLGADEYVSTHDVLHHLRRRLPRAAGAP